MKPFTTFTVGDSEYKLCLTIESIVTLEPKIGCNPLMVFGSGDKIPTVGTMVEILHASMQKYHHGTSKKDAMTVFSKWLQEGHAVTDFCATIVDIYKVSGLIVDDGEDEEAKN